MSKSPVTDASAPSDLVLVGYVAGAYGLKGWVRVRPFSHDADALLAARTWWIDRPALHDVEVMQSKLHVDEVVAQLMGVADRDAAEALKGTAVQVRRGHFPALDKDEFYWVDLIGLDVENLRGEPLGTVADLMESGAHPILVVDAAPAAEGEKREQLLIPFVDRFVHKVDQAARRITVDWERDY
ncbi:ribosome maturation factor RimM [Lacisediminimonas profundi]|uniref:ribosome maturation factor RimM n=1 Tax=Lacisediminimonas profundi TaxID=2603856 RepID=UPI00124B75F3|nr:ribosome maturation factor RimM [Lacisediminimonas profundi]